MSHGVMLTPRFGTAAADYAFTGTDFILDGSIGSARPWQMARDLASQCGVEFPAHLVASPVTRSAGGDFGNVAEWAIDSEACGEYVFSQAHALARYFTGLLHGELVCVLCPIEGARWCGSDWAFLYYLAESNVVLRLDRARHLPKVAADSGQVDDILRCIPGVLSDAILAQCDATHAGLIALKNKLWLVPPILRRPPSLIERASCDALLRRAAGIDWLCAYAQLYCSARHIQSAQLDPIIDDYYRGRHFALALSLQERLLRAENITAYGHGAAMLKLQMMRISSLNFDKAAAQNIPRDLPRQFTGLVILAKGWGHAMTNNPHQADLVLAEARSLLAPLRGQPEFLYALNISALVKFRIGHIVDAETMELEIEEQLRSQQPRRFALEYINRINLHRIYRHTGRPKLAWDYLDLATARTAGTRSHNDAIYTALNYWRMTVADGRTREVLSYALECLALFLALDTAESISSRTAAGLLNQPWPLRAPFGMEQLYASLKVQISACMPGPDKVPVAERVALSFAFSSEVDPATLRAAGRDATAVMMAGLGVIMIPDLEIDDIGIREAEGARRELHELFSDILLAHLPAEMIAKLDRSKRHLIVVDERFGCGMAKTSDELRSVAQRLHIGRICSHGRVTDFDCNLSEPLQVSAAPGVERVDDHAAHYKRMRAPIALAPHLRGLLRQIERAGAPIPLAEIGAQHLPDLRALESAGLCIVERA